MTETGLPSRPATIEEIELYLIHAGQGMSIVEVNTPAYRNQVMGLLSARLAERGLETVWVDYSRRPPQQDHLAYVQAELAERASTHTAILFLYNLEALAGPSPQEQRLFFRRFNFSRESYAALGRTLVWWLSSQAVNWLLAEARDFAHWVELIFDLTPLEQAAHPSPAYERAAIYEQLLAEAGEDVPPQRLLQLLTPLAEAYRQSHLWDKAEATTRQIEQVRYRLRAQERRGK